MTRQVPIVDISAFTSDTPLATRQEAAKDLAQKCSVNGCLGITGHGVSSKEIKDAFDLMARFYALPESVKMLAPHPDGPSPHRGYSPPGREKGYSKDSHEKSNDQQKAALAKTPDLKGEQEVYDMGDDENKQDYNIWLPEDALPGFREHSTRIYRWFGQLRNAILEALMLGMNLTESEMDQIRTLHTHVFDQLRYLHYLPVSRNELSTAESARLPAHTDFCSFTISFQDNSGGLEFLDRETGSFMPATPKEDLLYLNVGDILTRLSNDLYPACSHRVVVPPPRPDASAGDRETASERYSLVYFVPPHMEGVLKPQESCIAPGKKSAYEAVTFQEYIAEKVKWAYPEQQSTAAA